MNKINFPGRIEFDNILRNRVQNYLKANNIKETGTKIMQIKGLFCFLTSIVVFIKIVFNKEKVVYPNTNPFSI
jgi:hypothetical protein